MADTHTKPKIKEVIVVEGKDDVSALRKAVEADILITTGLGLTPKKIEEIKALAENAVAEYERHMYNHDFHRISYVLDEYIREINKHWVNNVKIADRNQDAELRKQIVADCFYACKIMAILVHPIAPDGCEMFREYMNFDEKLWNWDYILESLNAYTEDLANHELKFLEPRVDFFKKHECQFGSAE